MHYGLGSGEIMFAKKKSLQSKSEIALRNIVVFAIVAFNLIFVILPIIIAFIGSFHQWNPLKGSFKFLGWENYKNVFTSELFWKSMLNTLVFSVFTVSFRVILGLGLACALYSKLIKHKMLYRTVFYMPTVTPLIAVAFVWKFMFNPQIGVINQTFGFDINWLFDARTALGCVIFMTIWKDFGYAVVLFLSSLYSLPKDCFEAAEIDGASSWQVFRFITLPLLKPTTLFVVVTSIITYLQSYVQVMVMTEGGPGTKTFLATYLIYDQAFVKYNFGYASAISFIMFIVIAFFSALSFKITNANEA